MAAEEGESKWKAAAIVGEGEAMAAEEGESKGKAVADEFLQEGMRALTIDEDRVASHRLQIIQPRNNLGKGTVKPRRRKSKPYKKILGDHIPLDLVTFFSHREKSFKNRPDNHRMLALVNQFPVQPVESLLNQNQSSIMMDTPSTGLVDALGFNQQVAPFNNKPSNTNSVEMLNGNFSPAGSSSSVSLLTQAVNGLSISCSTLPNMQTDNSVAPGQVLNAGDVVGALPVQEGTTQQQGLHCQLNSSYDLDWDDVVDSYLNKDEDMLDYEDQPLCAKLCEL